MHDLHVWSLAGGMPVLSAHVQVADDRPLSSCDHLLEELNRLLGDRYHIAHSTIQFEWAGCETPDLYCNLMLEEEDATHDHEHEHGHVAPAPSQEAQPAGPAPATHGNSPPAPR